MLQINNKYTQLASPDIRFTDIITVLRVLGSGMLVQGSKVKKVENMLATFLDTPNASLVSNGTASLHIALVMLGVGPGDEVIVPAFSYVATANVVELVGATCIFADINLDTFNIDVTNLESLISEKTKAIIPVHEFGLCADMTAIMEIANKYKISVIEDAACAIGATHKGQKAGTIGDFGSFSFHPRKSITSGEGGCLIASSKDKSDHVKCLRNHGISVSSKNMDFIDAGFNYRMTDIQAALLLGQLSRLEKSLQSKRKIAAKYLSKIKNSKVKLPSVPNDSEHSWQTFHVLLQSEESRDQLSTHLLQDTIKTNYGAQCIPAMTYYRNKYCWNAPEKFPNAFRAFTCGLAIPIYNKLTRQQVNTIINSINRF
jgi:dTDP-4-amino-4,6-dideoxygalactose transaminase